MIGTIMTARIEQGGDIVINDHGGDNDADYIVDVYDDDNDGGNDGHDDGGTLMLITTMMMTSL